MIHEKEKDLRVILDCDVLVCGGGIAGVAAAIAAAREGAKVVLTEREYALGGLATLGLITIYLPMCDGLGHQAEYGLVEELLREFFADYDKPVLMNIKSGHCKPMSTIPLGAVCEMDASAGKVCFRL